MPVATTRPSRRKATSSTASSTSGLVRGDDGGAAGPVGAQPGGDPGLGVRVDGRGRLDEDQDLGVGGQGAGQHQPLPLAAGEACGRARSTTVSRPSGSASRMSSAEAVASAASTSPCPVTSSRSPSRPEKSVAPVSETTIRRRTSSRGSAVRGTPPSAHVVVDLGGAQAQPVGERGGLVGLLGDHGGQRPGADAQAGAGVVQVGRRRRGTARRLGVGVVGGQRQHAADPARRRRGRGSPCWRTRWRCAAGSSGRRSSRRRRPARRA